jgi:hypothetical protein
MMMGHGSTESTAAADAAAQYHNDALADGSACLQAALRYLSFGWSALAVCPRDHVAVGKKHASECKHPGKAPWGPWKEFQDRLPTEAELQKKWRDNPRLNVGLALGPVSGLIRLDVDGRAGEDELRRRSGGDVPPTLEFTSGNGRGLLYAIPPGVELRTTVEPLQVSAELRLQGKGAQSVLPPSRHHSGRRYQWVPGHGPDEIEAAIVPQWVAELMRADRDSARPAARCLGDGDLIPEGQRDTWLTSLAGTLRRRGAAEAAIEAALLAENAARCSPPLAESQVEKIVRSILRYAPAPSVAADGNGQHLDDVDKRNQQHARPNGVPSPGPKEEVISVCLGSVAAEETEWLWKLYIAFRAVNLLDGDPGLGKSTIGIDLAARVSRGCSMPTGPQEQGEPAGVLLLSAEDDLVRTVRPRLDQAGADVERVFSLEAVRLGDDERPPVLPWDLALVEGLIRQHGIRLVVVDPLMAYLDARIDSHSDQHVRRALHRLKLLADKTATAILVLRHLNKLNCAPALYRGGGSIGIIGAARSALVVGRDPNDRTKRVLASNKSNLGPSPKSIYYSLEPSGNVAKIGWGEVCDLTADEILGQPGDRQRQSVLDQCSQAVRDFLSDGPKPVKDLEAAMEVMGHSKRTCERARKKLKVLATKHGLTDVWMAELPPEVEDDDE